MSWDKLFSDKRERSTTTQYEPHRNCFDMDYDRIVYSSSLRRLQDKAQVFPLQENDFTRTRLTHSLEVSAIGRSLGASVGCSLREQGIFDESQEKKLSSLLSVTGLVHDLGNPPFGHYGEDVIKEWFLQSTKIGQIFKGENILKDYLYFDGNAQTIRILTRLQFLNDRHGINFCYGTLSTLFKYPWPSYDEKAVKQKFGYFRSEEKLCKEILEETGIINRHPATYLLEAADDIAYLFADLEDALKKGYLPWEKVFKEFRCLTRLGKDLHEYKWISKNIAKKHKNNIINDVPYSERDLLEIQNFKIYCQGEFIRTVCKEFINNYGQIMTGVYDGALLDCPSIAPFVKFISDCCVEYSYRNREVLALELVGKSVLKTLLDKFVFAVLDEENYKKPKTESGKLYRLISRNFEYVQKLNNESQYIKDKQLSDYERVQLVIDFITGMTDSYALNLHKNLLGLELP
jgi:dGTPase